MDRNSIIGIGLIGAIFVFMMVINKPSKEELARQQYRNDSIAAVQQRDAAIAQEAQATQMNAVTNTSTTVATVDSDASDAPVKENEFYTLENELIKLKVATKGGRPYSVRLKEYQTYDSLPLVLFDGDSTIFDLNYVYKGQPTRTNNLFFF